jgi:hypothetical protein
VNPGGRIVVAFLTAPLVASVTTYGALALFAAVPPLGFLIAAAVIAYLTILVLGVPAFLMTRPLHLRSLIPYVVVGAISGLVPAVIFGILLDDPMLFVAAIVGAAVAGLAFGAVLRRDLTMRWSGP